MTAPGRMLLVAPTSSSSPNTRSRRLVDDVIQDDAKAELIARASELSEEVEAP
jgi:hypothetical protein